MEEENTLLNIAPERGLLDLSVALSTRDITAGEQFALFVLVRNPFDKPVWVRRVHVSLPSELKLADSIETKAKGDKQKIENTPQEEEEQRIRLEAKFNNLNTKLNEILSQLKDDSGNSDEYYKQRVRIEQILTEIKVDLIDLENRENRENRENKVIIDGKAMIINNIAVDSSLPSKVILNGDEPSVGSIIINNTNRVLQESFQTRTIELESSLPSYAALQPASTAVYTAVLYVKNSFIFSPSQYRLQFNVIYSFKPTQKKPYQEGKQNPEINFEQEVLSTNTIAHEISIRPSVTSIIVGSAIGGLVGSLARLLQNNPSLTWSSLFKVFFVPLSLSVILSAVAIVFLARKADDQSFVSVEDFWGGLLVGFLTGYTGASFFAKLTGVSPTS